MPPNLPINIGWTMRETEEKRGRKPREKEKARRRRRRRSMRERQGDEDGGGREEDDDEEEKEDDGRVLGVFVHHSDYLPIGDQNILHPNVKVISTILCVLF